MYISSNDVVLLCGIYFKELKEREEEIEDLL